MLQAAPLRRFLRLCFAISLVFVIWKHIFAQDHDHVALRRILEASSQEQGKNFGRRAKYSCQKAHQHPGFTDSCSYVMALEECQSGGSIEYIRIFFCSYASDPWLGYITICLWLIALFYMLGNTAADYFCSCLERLSSLLHLPPTVAGVTLLPLGNGAPDVFAGVVAFSGTSSGAEQLGMNSLLGGAVFVVTVVAGIVSILISRRTSSIQLDRRCFIRDACFFLFSLSCLLLILLIGRITIWGAMAYLMIYLLYAGTVAASGFFFLHSHIEEEDDPQSLQAPLLDHSSLSLEHAITVPQWMWASQVAIYSQQSSIDKDHLFAATEEGADEENEGAAIAEEENEEEKKVFWQKVWWLVLKALEILIKWPLMLPRRFTIPIVDHTRWSRSTAVISMSLSPLVLVFIWSTENATPLKGDLYGYAIGSGVGIFLGIFGILKTEQQHPPKNMLLLAMVGLGFVMSIVWFYVIAKELVAVMVSLGVILGLDAGILGLTVLAWGNSMGDMMANLGMVYQGGDDGVQIALTGCYAGPMFSTLVGLGLSLLVAAARVYPMPYIVPRGGIDSVGFLMAALLWSLINLPIRGSRMKPTRVMGVGLMVLYVLFVAFKSSQALGIVNL